MKKVSKEVMTIGLDLIDSLKEVRLANHKISHAHALLWLINRRVRQKCQYSKNGRSFELLPGEVMSSYEAMSRAWHWDIKTVRSFISGLETGGYVTIKTCYYGVVLTFPKLRLEDVGIDDESSNGGSPSVMENGINPIEQIASSPTWEPDLFAELDADGTPK